MKQKRRRSPAIGPTPGWLRTMLHLWGKWLNSSNGYTDSTTTWRAAHAAFGGMPRSMPPPGVEPPSGLAALVETVHALLDDECLGPSIMAMRDFYALGPKRACAENGISRRTLFTMRQRGELAVLAYFKACGTD